jgi:hypothetical protein
MSSSYGHHAASGPSPGGQASFHPGAYSNISPLAPLRKSTQVPSQLMGSSHSKSSNPGPSSFKAAVSGGIGFKRVFASKRKKSLDLSARSAEHDLPRPVSTVDTSPEVNTYYNYLLLRHLCFFRHLILLLKSPLPNITSPRHHHRFRRSRYLRWSINQSRSIGHRYSRLVPVSHLL